jgi:HEAT repeat protein
MTGDDATHRTTGGPDPATGDGRSDLKVVLQFFIVPLVLVAVLVAVFFGLQVLRGHRPDPRSSLAALRSQDGFLIPWVGDPKRWQSGYDLSLLLRSEDPQEVARLIPELSIAFREAGTRNDLQLRRYLALVLGRTSHPASHEALREGIRDADSQTRLFSAWGLANASDRSVLPDLRKALGDVDPGVRMIAAYALGHLGDRTAAPALAVALEDVDGDVRSNAALALARIGDRRGAPVLIQLLERSLSQDGPDHAATGGDKELALNAIRGLALLKVDEARSSLDRAATSASDPAVQEAARQALDSYGDDSRKTLP